jgi:hypothetical protein
MYLTILVGVEIICGDCGYRLYMVVIVCVISGVWW